MDVALDGCEGHWMAPENAYDAMVLDSMLPGMSGPVMCVPLRDAGVWTPILMLTASGGEREEAQALDAGADDFLAKPFSYDVLLARLRALLRRGGPERPLVLAAGDLARPRRAPRLAWGHAGPADPRQFSLLEYLMRHAGDVLSKPDHGARLGLHVRRRPQHRRGLRPSAAAPDRRAVRQNRASDRARSGLPAGSRRWLTGGG